MTGHISHTTDLSIQTYGSIPISKKRTKNAYLETPPPHPFQVRPNKANSIAPEIVVTKNQPSTRFTPAFDRASIAVSKVQFASQFASFSDSSETSSVQENQNGFYSDRFYSEVARFSENFLEPKEFDI